MSVSAPQTVAVIGLGYVGLPLALRFAEVGCDVIGLDNDPDKVAALAAGASYIGHIPAERLKTLTSEHFQADTDLSRVAEADAVILCLPTPLDENRQPDLSYVVSTVEDILPHLRAGQTVSLESTTYPGTTEEEIAARIRARGLTVGEDVFVVYSPEREDPGRSDFTLQTTPKVIGGVTQACLKRGIALYERIVDRLVPVSSARAAEMTKLLENIHRAVNIGLVNEMKVVADAMDIDIHEVIEAAATKPFGFVPYQPGPGLGGHCIPIDPYYLTWKAREFGVDTRFIELAGEINRAMPARVVDKTEKALQKKGETIRGSRILILGIAYKKNVDDMRETPAAEIMKLLEERGALLSYSDPHVPRFKKMRNYRFALESVALTPDAVKRQNCIILVTDHDAFDYDLIRKHAALLIDTRGRFRTRSDRIVSA